MMVPAVSWPGPSCVGRKLYVRFDTRFPDNGWFTAAPLLAQSGAGSIVNIASIAALRPSIRSPAYAAVKAAVIQYTSSQAAMLARQNVRVNCIAPGSIEFAGGTWEKRRVAGDPLYDRVLKSIPFGRLGTPEEIAEVALFLASPHARWITGQTIAVDGGQLLGS